MDLRPGDEVFGETAEQVFRVESVLGSGGFGIVYLVRDKTGSRFALKTIASAYLNDTELAALVNEGRVAVGIRHPNVLSVHYLHDGTTYPGLPPYMLMEYADGGTLANVLRERREGSKVFESDELREVMRQLAEGMSAISQKLVHRDLKPDNVLLVGGVLKIADFGLAKLAGAATRSQTFKGIGHIRYASPESWKLDKNLPTMDVYSMGLVFFELATLRHAYTVPDAGDVMDGWRRAHLTTPVPDPRSLNPRLDLATAQLILKMTAKRAADRYQTWAEVLTRLSQNAGADSKSRPNVSALVEKALKTKAYHESARLAAERAQAEAAEKRSLVEVSFREVLDVARALVDAFNESSDTAKLEMMATGLSVRVFPKGRSGPRGGIDMGEVVIGVEPAPEGKSLDMRPILAWGGARAPSGMGFNLILTQLRDDIYGQWRTLHNEHSPLARQRDNRPDPFPFGLGELPEEIMHLNAIHVFQSRKGTFKAEQLAPLLEELL